jgi:GT2 family glycosyltransferase
VKRLSIIIVNYNVKHFLEHCLLSVFRAIEHIDAEVFVVDNQSTDGSVELVRVKFPDVTLIANTNNVGFARANNQAVRQCNGEYVLYLNPDTIVAEDCFEKCLIYMDAHPEVGGLGPKLIDGKGIFLPESKRGFPSAWVAFCKISGLSSLFKKSKRFNQYHQGFLPEDEISEVDVLVGCFMLCRKKVIDKVGSFDETYFMYGEDIDLSYQIKKGGFKNVYFPETTVIHYKGESTKKGSLNYVRMFYKAMIIFAKKNFAGGQKGLYVLLITLAIYFRGIIAFFRRLFSIFSLPILDSIILLTALGGMLTVWKNYVKPDTTYSTSLLAIFFFTYLLSWIGSIFFSGGYDKPYKAQRVLRGMLVGSIIILSIYALLPEDYRFSRGITVLGALSGTLAILLARYILQRLGVKSVQGEDQLNKQTLIVGHADEEKEIKGLIERAGIHKNFIGAVSPTEEKYNYQITSIDKLKPITNLYRAGEIIFSQHHLSFKEIISQISSMGENYDFKIHSFGTDSIIGSNSKNTAGDLYTTEAIYNISSQGAKRNKRVVDILFSLFFILLSPLLIWFVKDKRSYFKYCILTLEGDRTFVGYDDPQFPTLRAHIFPVYTPIPNFFIPTENVEHLNWMYAKDYDPWWDVKIILENWRRL